MKNVFQNAKWIGEGDRCTDNNYAPLLTSDFNIDFSQYDYVNLSITGLGLFKCFINGKEIYESCYFLPGESHYGKRVYYISTQINHAVKDGQNSISILLGNGQYANYIVSPTMEKDGQPIPPHRYQKNDGDVPCGIYGNKKAIAVIEGYNKQKNEMIPILVTDENWAVESSHITFQNWYGGEDCDFTKEIIPLTPTLIRL